MSEQIPDYATGAGATHVTHVSTTPSVPVYWPVVGAPGTRQGSNVAPGTSGSYYDPSTLATLEGLRQAIADLGALARQTPAPQSSVELSQTAKGATQVSVKVYSTDPAEAVVSATNLYDMLVGRYARGEAP